MSENAVRQKIKRGTIRATKVDGQWRVWPSDQEPTSRPTPSTDHADYQAEEPIEVPYRVTPAEIEQALTAATTQYSSDLAAMFDRLDELYQARLTDKDLVIAELRRRAEVAEQERDQLREEARAATQVGIREMSATRPWWRRWGRKPEEA